MSDALYPTRLRWHHTCGVARHDGVSVELRHAPALPGLDCMTELDFIPGVMAEVRIGCEEKRDMTNGEREHALKLLSQMSSEARDLIDGASTIVVICK